MRCLSYARAHCYMKRLLVFLCLKISNLKGFFKLDSNMVSVCKTVHALKLFLDTGYRRLVWDLEEADEILLDWSIHQDANTIRWLLNHISTILYVYIPRAITGDLNYTTKKWQDYHEKKGLKDYLREIQKGKAQADFMLEGLNHDMLEEELDWYIGVDTRNNYLVLLVSEILHHEGQVAATIGLKERIEGHKARINPPE